MSTMVWIVLLEDGGRQSWRAMTVTKFPIPLKNIKSLVSNKWLLNSWEKMGLNLYGSDNFTPNLLLAILQHG